MPRKEFVSLIEKNVIILDWLAGQLKPVPPAILKSCTRQQMKVLMRLYLGGRAKLKDIASRELIPTSNLCSTFRCLESDKLVVRQIDTDDRRNTWYDVSPKGAQIAKEAMEEFRGKIAELFQGISTDEEKELTAALKKLNETLNKIKTNRS